MTTGSSMASGSINDSTRQDILFPDFEKVLDRLFFLPRPGNLDITSSTLAAVMCDEDDPCSVYTTHEPVSSGTVYPCSTT